MVDGAGPVDYELAAAELGARLLRLLEDDGASNGLACMTLAAVLLTLVADMEPKQRRTFHALESELSILTRSAHAALVVHDLAIGIDPVA
jgi:hypothetical protein